MYSAQRRPEPTQSARPNGDPGRGKLVLTALIQLGLGLALALLQVNLDRHKHHVRLRRRPRRVSPASAPAWLCELVYGTYLAHAGVADDDPALVDHLDAPLELVPSVAGLLVQLAHGGGGGVLVAVDQPGGQLNADGLDRRAVLQDDRDRERLGGVAQEGGDRDSCRRNGGPRRSDGARAEKESGGQDRVRKRVGWR